MIGAAKGTPCRAFVTADVSVQGIAAIFRPTPLPPMRFLVLLLALIAPAVAAQPLTFGSADAPAEAPPLDVRPTEARISVLGGPAYIGAEWQTGLGLELEAAAGPFSTQIGGRFHAGVDGLYEPETDELYDLVRAIRHARFDPTPALPLYARVGPLERVTLGTGHLVRSFQTTSAWDERTIGIESAVRFPFIEAAAFASDVRFNGLVGGRVGTTPFGDDRQTGLPSLALGATALTDLGLEDSLATTAVSLDARFDVLRLGDFALSPYATYATFLEYGSGFGAGVEFGGRNLGDFGRLVATAGFFVSGDRFIPGYFNAFYPLANPESAILSADAFYDDAPNVTVGTPLAEADGGTSLVFGLNALVFGSFELATYVRRSYTDAELSEAGFRIALTPGRGERFRFLFDVQRQGRTSLWSLFGDFRDQNVLLFHIDYALAGPARLFIRSRYGYRRVNDASDGQPRYLVERRFEPLVGVRFVFR